MLVRELLEKIDDLNSEIDWIEIVCNGESELLGSHNLNKECFDKEVKKISLRTLDEYSEDMDGMMYMSDTSKFLVIEVE